MRWIIKILLFPVVVVLTIMVAVGRFVSDISGWILGLLSVLAFVSALGVLLILKSWQIALMCGIAAFAISPYGIPLLLRCIVEWLDVANDKIKSI